MTHWLPILEWTKNPANNFLCKDIATVQAKIERLQIDSMHGSWLAFDELVIADFDMTLTQYNDPATGKRSMSSHGALENWSRLPRETKERMNLLYQKYYPMEVSSTISHHDKLQAMIAWWTAAHDNVVSLCLERKDIAEIVQESRFVFRPRLREFLDLLESKQIPLLIFSAGLHDIIYEILHSQPNLWKEHMDIVSNKMIFNEHDICVGFEDPLIHVLNKSEAGMGKDHHAKIAHRSSVIVMGDSLGDLAMADGVAHDVKLTIGFLNHDYDRLLPVYLDAFDIVLTNDTSLEFLLVLLSHLR
ncbi:hypothetical protein HDU91_004902 [Kappamyces sp. JEL0680]|nr:hypothetical protein HDU91_004902 [Kappamyces sp. JEL0680]